jgi:hypothetical protein
MQIDRHLPPPPTNQHGRILSWGGGWGEERGGGGSEVARVTHFTQSPHINIYPRLAALLVNGKHRLSHVVCTSPPPPTPLLTAELLLPLLTAG